MCIIHEYIQQAYQRTLGYAPDYDDICWQLDENVGHTYVNTQMLFENEQLTAVMETMLERLDTDDAKRERSRKVLTLWINATNWLANELEHGYMHLPRVHPQISGRTDQLLRADIMPLYELDESVFREASGQGDSVPDEYVTLAQFRQSERYWFRFMDHLERSLRDVSHQCAETLTQFVSNCTFEARRIRRWCGNTGDIRLYMAPQPIDEIDIMEFEDDFLTQHVDAIAAGIYVPVTFRADIHYRNGAVMKSFTGDTEVNDPERPNTSDYYEVMVDAIGWIREESEHVVSLVNTASLSISSLNKLAA
ncbi:conserved hypothetical protein [Pectobacterium atrosepticum SCRI1043]|uniref:Uncharacterized protein n=1 Tax=Pectobacterium atrosepticum (strain SCRI 1043 / ATCC BAA-672) TaxID=218491 RepID=Q6D9L5_PECAS|nr:hypothetical protein [Pectobacterium atrosepticum]AIA69930.1 hypothetical protein EV46_04855 [Pectobacterium atrosepticum]AIK12847.1 hypothetical protein GZ59_09840 [Pectobacterium atrosepticum]ATY89423.1 hypothetical protein CVS35_03090 [Pectobacterium atrosepticum]KFX24012.1 hypothetical protein KP24_12885 [Pectobacterium atrosepticum]MBL0893089.1 hypothetical protein [Pectobacterium atrosepticum]